MTAREHVILGMLRAEQLHSAYRPTIFIKETDPFSIPTVQTEGTK
jgi:hypothetical protein